MLCRTPEGECSRHLLVCEALWQPLADSVGIAVLRLRQTVAAEAGYRPDAHALIDRGILRLSWGRQRPETLTLALQVAHALLNRYRRRALSIDKHRAEGIWHLRVYGAGAEADLGEAPASDDGTIEHTDDDTIEHSDVDTIVDSEAEDVA